MHRTALAAINAEQLATPTDRLLFAPPIRRVRRSRVVEQPTVYVREHLEPAQRFAFAVIIPMIGCAIAVLAVLQ
ncbi:MAG TPA: hypothetical protein VGM88_23820 [Kofleriaceae bacterium]|jgi:hypothetical protein